MPSTAEEAAAAAAETYRGEVRGQGALGWEVEGVGGWGLILLLADTGGACNIRAHA